MYECYEACTRSLRGQVRHSLIWWCSRVVTVMKDYDMKPDYFLFFELFNKFVLGILRGKNTKTIIFNVF